MATEPGWALDLSQSVGLDGLEELDGSSNRADADLHNTIIVDRVLGTLSASLANEERIWVRLSHVEGFEYSRDRWLKSNRDKASQEKAVRKHFFAHGQTGVRDDHALSRLWWNSYVVRRCYPGDFSEGLALLLATADVRSNLVERIWLTGRRQLAAGVFRAMKRDQRVLASEDSFREFMKALNFLGGGVVFEAMTDDAIDQFMLRCADRAQTELDS